MRTLSVESLVGRRFGRLTVSSYLRTDGGRIWLCRCDCGNSVEAKTKNLNYGSIKSCGCLHKDSLKKLRTHYLCSTSEYRCWARILQKCNNPKTKEFKFYGGRGIRVCRRWYKFENFLADMGRKPTQKHSINRINNDGDYVPDNCEWATRREQDRNTSRTILITAFGRTQCITDWGRELGIKPDTIKYRLNAGLPVELALVSRHYVAGQVSR